jgi:hypothetical protein
MREKAYLAVLQTGALPDNVRPRFVKPICEAAQLIGFVVGFPWNVTGLNMGENATGLYSESGGKTIKWL